MRSQSRGRGWRWLWVRAIAMLILPFYIQDPDKYHPNISQYQRTVCVKKLKTYQIEPQFGKVPSFVGVHSFAQPSTFFTMCEQRFKPGECDVQHVVQGATFGTTCNVTTCLQRLVFCTICHVLHNYLPKIGRGLSPRRRFWPQINFYHNGSRRFCHMQRKLNLHHSVK